MASYNKIIIMGNVTRDPQLSYLPNNTPVVEIGMAINHKYKDSAGNQQEKVCFIDCKAFGKRAEVLNQYIKKGDPLLIEGRLELDTWTDKEGKNRSKHGVFVESFSFVGSPQGQEQAPRQQAAQQQQQHAPMPDPRYDTPMPGDNEPPF